MATPSYDVAIVGAGPNGLRLMACLQRARVRYVAFERGSDIGATVARWYEGSVTHSPRRKLIIAGIEPEECTACLDDVWQDAYLLHDHNATRQPEPSSACTLGDGERVHCARDDFVRYMRRAQQVMKLRVRVRHNVLSIVRQDHRHRQMQHGAPVGSLQQAKDLAVSAPPFVVTTQHTSKEGRELWRSRHTARAVVLACGESSAARPLPLLDQSRRLVSRSLGKPGMYRDCSCVVVGSGPSGLETAVRLCNYGATHVHLLVRGSRLAKQRSWWQNPYMKQTLLRVVGFEQRGLLTVHRMSALHAFNGTHAQIGTVSLVHIVRAEHVIAAIGFTSDEALIGSIRFPSSNLSRAGETSIPNLFNLAVSHVHPWVRTRGTILGTNIEDSTAEVDAMCAELRDRFQRPQEAGRRLSPAREAERQPSSRGIAATSEDIASLRAEILTLRQRVDTMAASAASARAGPPAHLHVMPAEPSARSTRFVPVPSTDCYGVLPCVHSTPTSRISAGCTEAVWEGTFGSVANGTTLAASGGGVASRYVSDRRPLPPPPDRIPPEAFQPAIGAQCDLVDIWTLSKLHKGHVKDAVEAAWHKRLRGVKNGLWLSVGSSIDHAALKEACAAFGQEKSVLDADAEPSKLPWEMQHEKGNPWPSVLLVSWCYVRSLNLTLAHVVAQGIATTALQTNASLQRLRFAEIGAQLQRIPSSPFGATRHEPSHGGSYAHSGSHAHASSIPRSPTFVSFGGIEWDFRNWHCDYPRPTCAFEWREPISTLEMQAAAVRRAWPTVRAVFVRTVFKPTTGGFGCDCCAREAAFLHYNELLRRNARGPIRGGLDVSTPDEARDVEALLRGSDGGRDDGRDGASGAAVLRTLDEPGGRSTQDEPCNRIHVLDLQRMMLCNESVGSCSSHTGWTVDGIHPSRPVVLGYVALALQVMADWGSACAAGVSVEP